MSVGTLFASEQSERLASVQLVRLILCFAVAVLPHVFHVPIWVVLAAGGMCFWRYRLEETGRPLPSILTRLLMAFALLVGVWIEIGGLGGRDAGTALMVGLVGIKFLEVRDMRDYMVVSFVLYFLAIIALLFEQSIPVFMYVMVAVGVITWALMRPQFGEREPLPGRPMARFAVILLVQALPLAVLLFIAFPRLDGRFGFNLGQAQTGVPDQVRPGAIAELARNDTMAFRAEILEIEAPPPTGLYWRALVLWSFNAATHEWLQGAPGGDFDRLTGGKALTQRITLPATGKLWLFCLDQPAGELDPPWLGQIRKPGHTLQAFRAVNRKVQYQITSMAGATLMSTREGEPGNQIPEATRIANEDLLHPDVKELAAQLAAGATSDEQIVENVLAHFRKQDFQYTTSPGRYTGDATYQFLFQGKRGFCEHFASAFAVLLRLNEIPARLVVGYQGGEYNPYGRFYVVRQSDAHAWTEVYLKERGWVRYDPTLSVSPARIIQGAQTIREREGGDGLTVAGVEVLQQKWLPWWARAIIDEASFRWQQADEMWDRWVLAYNFDSQQQVLELMGLTEYGWEAFSLLAIVAAGLTTFGVLLSVLRRERLRDPIPAAYAEFSRLLEAEGIARHRWEGPQDYGGRACRMLPEVAPAIREFTERYVRCRYGKRFDTIEDPRILRALIRGLRVELVRLHREKRAQLSAP